MNHAVHHRAVRRLLPLVALLVFGFAAPRADAGGAWSIVATYAVPEGASGLAWDGTWLYCGIYAESGGGRVYRIDPSDGTSTLLFTGPHQYAFGLTYDGQYLWTTDHPGASSTPAIAMKLDWDGTLLEQFDLPAHYVSGIVHEGGDFWVSRYHPNPGHMYRVDATGTLLDEFDGPDDQPWDLCFENGTMWIADYWGDTLYKVDPATGAVLDSHPSEGVDPAGIVWDGTHLWYCDNGEGGVDFLYKVDLSGIGTPDIDLPAASHDFGTVSIGQVATWDMIVANTGTAPLQISAVDFGGHPDLSVGTTLPLTIPAGLSDQVEIVFTPSVFGVLDLSASVTSTDPIHPSEPVALTGAGVFPDPTIALADNSHDYGSVRSGAHTRWFLEIANHGNQVLTVSGITVDDPRFYLDEGAVLPVDLAPLATTTVGFWFNAAGSGPFAATATIASNDAGFAPAEVSLSGSGLVQDWPIGDTLWTFDIVTGFDSSPKAMASIPDISGDGVDDVIVCSEDDYVRCFNGNGHGIGDVLWANDFGVGYVYSQKGIQIIPDIDEDGFHDVVVGTAGERRVVRALSGKSGVEIWTYDTAEYGNGGWVYQVDAAYDFNGDGSVDVLASTGDDSTDTGPKRVFCLNGLTGIKLWERALGGPVFAVMGVEDITGDDLPDVVAGASSADETQGRAVGLNGIDGSIRWNFFVSGSSVWALAQLDDINADGTSDVMVGDFLTGTVHGVDARAGVGLYSSGGFGIITRFEPMGDIDGDGTPDVVPAHSNDFARLVSGRTGAAIWTTPLADNASVAARMSDISGDGVDDLVVGTLFTNNVTYFLDGAGGSVLQSGIYGEAVDAITAIPDVTGDGSWEMVAGGRNGLVTCISGGISVDSDLAGDTDGDGDVDVNDLNNVILDWGSDGSANGGDITGPAPGSPPDGVVNVNDLNAVIVNWGACP